jgi:VIT1/CCC1 family predicted Fe2+/Mn2+ transporter
LQRAIAAHLDSRQVSRVIYGAIVGLALVLAMERHPPSAAVVIGTLLATAVAVALAELYSEVVGTSARLRHRIEGHRLRHALHDAVAVAIGVAFPVVFFGLAAAGAMELHTAFDVAKWSGLGLIGFYGFCAARLSGSSVPNSLLQATAVGALGAVLIAIKALVH